jgi:hypothetical protein
MQQAPRSSIAQRWTIVRVPLSDRATYDRLITAGRIPMPSSSWSALTRALGCALVLLAVVTPAAAAETRTAVAVDLTGDGPTPGRDITAVRAHWDSAGSLAVTAAFAGPVGEADRAQLTANARAATGRTCLLESQDTYLLLSGYTGPASSDDRGFGIGSPGWLSLDTGRVRDDAGRTVTLFLDDPRIGEYDLGCVDVRLSADGATVDGVASVFFGDGVDSDGDGVDDSSDACPATPAVTLNGCPAGVLPTERRPPPPSRVRTPTICNVPAVTGRSLSSARWRLLRSGCRLGRVTRRGRTKGPGKWIVRRQSARPRVLHEVGTRVAVVVRRKRS